MKVLVFSSLYPNNIWTHHGVFVKERMTHFAKRDGCEVKVVAPVPYFPPIKLGFRWRYSQVLRHETRDGLDVYHPRYVMPPKIGMTLYGLLMFLSVLPTVKRIRKEFDFDLIDGHFIYPDGFAAVWLGWYFKKPVVVSARGTDINLYKDFPLIRRMLQHTLHRADGVIAVCQALKDSIVSLGIPDSKVAVVPNGVDPEKFAPCPQEEARRTLDIPANKKVILSVGGLVPRKGFDLLIMAVAILRKEAQHQNLSLVIAGEGSSRKDLEQLVMRLGLADHVRLVGDVPHHELYLWYSAADLFCLASSREGWPNVVLESLACGTPVVATEIWGTPEIIRSSEVGLLTKRTEQHIAETLDLALRQPWKPEVIRQFAAAHTWSRVAQSVNDVFETAIKAEKAMP